MAQIDNGPATGNGVLVFGNTASVEFHAAVGANSLGPLEQANPVVPKTATTLTAQTSKNTFFGGTAFVKFLNPA